MNIQDWSPLGLTGWISLLSRESQESSPTPLYSPWTSPGQNTGVGCHCLLGLIFKIFTNMIFSSVQSLSRVRLSVTPWTAARQASLSITNSWSLLKFMSIESVMPSNHLILSSPSLPTFNLCQHQGLFQWISSLHQVAKVLEFQLQHQSFQWIFRTDFL